MKDLAYRQKKNGQWVDDMGVLVMATALYRNRNINIYSYLAEKFRDYNLTFMEGDPGADALPAFNVFFDSKHYQSLKLKGAPSLFNF